MISKASKKSKIWFYWAYLDKELGVFAGFNQGNVSALYVADSKDQLAPISNGDLSVNRFKKVKIQVAVCE